jgi:hypothetical protein
MPVIRDIPLSLKTGAILRRQGIGGRAKLRPEIKGMIQELLAGLENEHLLEPAASYEYYRVSGMNSSQISMEGGKSVNGPALPAILPESRELVVLIGTIGPKLEKRASGYTQKGEALRGMLLDGIGSAAVDTLVAKVIKIISAEASRRGYEVSSPVNPGMPGFPMSEQWNLVELAKAHEIGVSLTQSGILVPRKSTSMVIGVGPRMTRWTQAEVCARCSLNKTCPYKIDSGVDDDSLQG